MTRVDAGQRSGHSCGVDAKAQTILQLYAQLARRGFDDETLHRVHRAYAFTVSNCTCQYRSSGRTLIDHAVGQASILAMVTPEPALVVAGLVHQVYLHGEFGTFRRRILPSHRAAVERAAGSDAEGFAYRYTHLDWSVTNLPAIRARLDHEPALRPLVLMRLADAVDIYGEYDALYCHNVRKRCAYAREHGPILIAMAEALQQPELAAQLHRGFAEMDAAPGRIRALEPPWRDGAIIPPSYRTTRPIAWYRGARARIYRLTGR